MPASFAKGLCGYRSTGLPNTSDSSDSFSVEIGRALFEALGVSTSTVLPEPTGSPFSTALAKDLTEHASSQRHVTVSPEMKISSFDQFRHIGLLHQMSPEPSREFESAWSKLTRFTERRITRPADARKLDELMSSVRQVVATEAAQRQALLDAVGEESLLKLDVTVARGMVEGVRAGHLEVGLSLKWSLRTDRAQDCRSQAAKMASLRRGRMPHVAAVTMEPRPYFLNLLGQGSGDLDCVYHLDLPALEASVEATCKGRSLPRKRTYDSFRRLIDQGRLRDYGDLVAYVLTL